MVKATLQRITPRWAKSATRPLRDAARSVVPWIASRAVAARPSRAVLNAIVNAEIPYVSAPLLQTLARSCWGRGKRVSTGLWRVRLPHRTVTLAMGPDLPLLAALAVLQHDPGVKAAYARILRHARPDIFLDVGANVGSDSFFFLASGVPAISFEPNPTCHPAIRAFAAAAGVAARIEPVAISDSHGEATLQVPRGRSWLGSIEAATAGTLEALGPLTTFRVATRRLDDWLPDCAGRRVLIKIDTEGHEPAVLRGAATILREVRPAVVFEAWPGPARDALHRQLAVAGYTVRVAGDAPQKALSEADFRAAKDTNFVALPDGKEADWGFG